MISGHPQHQGGGGGGGSEGDRLAEQRGQNCGGRRTTGIR